ncbi:hypothetical protein T11_12858 [Trichinella zimbabwensis]|uniref:Uncharacterized protein n=1 Tax=Trichinella zimbabwensis TaxID=268475 RepID=A0A0V1HTT2_9BILA|nr:hypothetical protein T11_12858 [Trichinella zimbabwensis]
MIYGLVLLSRYFALLICLNEPDYAYLNDDVSFHSRDIFTLCRKSTPLMHLIFSFLQADPDILTMRTVLRLFDLNDEIQRHKVLQTKLSY